MLAQCRDGRPRHDRFQTSGRFTAVWVVCGTVACCEMDRTLPEIPFLVIEALPRWRMQ